MDTSIHSQKKIRVRKPRKVITFLGLEFSKEKTKVL